MKERIKRHIAELTGMRNEALEAYLQALNGFDPKTGSMLAVTSAGILHDLDRHITNLQLEVKRIEAEEFLNEANKMALASVGLAVAHV